MGPRNTKHGASAKSPRTASPQRRRAASSSARSSAPKRKTKPAVARRPESPGARWWMVPALVVAVIFAFGWVYYPVAAVQYREVRNKAELEAELDSLKARNERLRGQVDRLKTPAGVEDYARSQLGLVKRGENVVVVVDGNAGAEPSSTAAGPVIDSDETTVAPAGAWTAFLDLVFGVQ